MATKKTLIISVQYQPNGAWTPCQVDINPQKFLDAKSKPKYIKELAEYYSIGLSVVSVDFNYTEQDAKRDLGD